jgi:hypothetical protein
MIRRWGADILIALFLLLGAVGLSCLARSAPLVHYVPVSYSVLDDQPQEADPFSYPQLWVRDEGLHKINLAGVRFAVWSPPMKGAWMNPKAHMTVSLNYWGVEDAPGQALVVSGFQDPTRSFMPGVSTDSTSTIDPVGSGAVVTSMTDSTLTVKAWWRLTNPTWPTAWTDTTYKTLVPEGWQRVGQP